MNKQQFVKTAMCNKYSNATGGMREGFGDLERASCGDFSVTFGGQGSRRRTPAIAGELRSGLHGVAEPRAQLLILSLGFKT
jgi:hypothetical protein